MRALDRKLLRDLWRLKTQIGAIALVIGAGIGIVVMSFGTMRSLADTRDAYYDRTQFADLFARAKRAPLSLMGRIEEIPDVARAEARIVVDVRLDMIGLDAPASARVVSLPPGGRPGLNQVVMRSGRLPSPEAVDEALVSEAFAAAHRLALGGHLVADINGRRRTLTITGIALSPEFIYALPPGQLMPDNRRFGVLWMNEAALAAAFDLDGAFNDLAVRLRRGAGEAAVIAAIDGMLERYGGGGAPIRAWSSSRMPSSPASSISWP